MLYIASVPGFILAVGMQFAVDSPRWLCKVSLLSFTIKVVSLFFLECLLMLFVQVGRLSNAKEIIKNVWGASEVEKAIEEFQSVIKNDGSDLDSSWLELLEEPNSRGCFKVDFRCLSLNGIFMSDIIEDLRHLLFCPTFCAP